MNPATKENPHVTTAGLIRVTPGHIYVPGSKANDVDAIHVGQMTMTMATRFIAHHGACLEIWNVSGNRGKSFFQMWAGNKAFRSEAIAALGVAGVTEPEKLKPAQLEELLFIYRVQGQEGTKPGALLEVNFIDPKLPGVTADVEELTRKPQRRISLANSGILSRLRWAARRWLLSFLYPAS